MSPTIVNSARLHGVTQVLARDNPSGLRSWFASALAADREPRLRHASDSGRRPPTRREAGEPPSMASHLVLARLFTQVRRFEGTRSGAADCRLATTPAGSLRGTGRSAGSLQLIGIRTGVADVGAGSGWLAPRECSIGRQACLLTTFRWDASHHSDKANAEHPRTSRDRSGHGHRYEAPGNAIDLAPVVYHEMWHPQEMLRSIRRSLKPGA